nr:MAG TPA: hypothetical protein [Caudoviricetes sp.]
MSVTSTHSLIIEALPSGGVFAFLEVNNARRKAATLFF